MKSLGAKRVPSGFQALGALGLGLMSTQRLYGLHHYTAQHPLHCLDKPILSRQAVKQECYYLVETPPRLRPEEELLVTRPLANVSLQPAPGLGLKFQAYEDRQRRAKIGPRSA